MHSIEKPIFHIHIQKYSKHLEPEIIVCQLKGGNGPVFLYMKNSVCTLCNADMGDKFHYICTEVLSSTNMAKDLSNHTFEILT